MKSQGKPTSAKNIRFFGPSARWKGYQRANVHWLYFEKGLRPHEIAFLTGLPLAKILPSVRRAAYALKPASKSPDWKPYRPRGWREAHL